MSTHTEPGAQPGISERRWLTIDDICAELPGLTRSTVDKWRARGKGPRFKRMPNGRLLCRRDWFEAWLDGLEDDPFGPGVAA